MIEKWKLVDGWPGYEVSSKGRVRRTLTGLVRRGVKAGRLMTVTLNSWGYPTVYLKNLTKRTGVHVHRLVAIAFISPPPTADHRVNHINSDKMDPRVENLEWVTHAENMQHAYRSGAVKVKAGSRTNENAHHKVLTWEMVRSIKKAVAQGQTMVSLAAKYKVGYRTVTQVIDGTRWRDEDDPE